MAVKLHRLRQPLWQAAFIVFGLLLCSFYLAFVWVSTLPPFLQVLLGTALGLTSVASYSNTQMQRSRNRERTSVNLAQLSLADVLALRKLLPNNEKALSWMPGPSDAELVRWINAGLEKVWPYLKEASSGIIKVNLERAYNNYKAGMIKELSIGKINLGNCCPFIEGLKFVPNNKENQCCLEVEVEVDWRQNENQDMLLHVSTVGPEFVVQVKNFVMYCVLRLTFTPLVWELPGFAAVVVSIVEPPLVDFQTKFISGDVKQISGMEKAVDNILLSALMDILVWPGRVVLPVLPGDYRDLEASCIGHLHVWLIEARDLANRDVTGRSDPYVVLYLRRRNDLIKQTTQMRDTTDPVWNEQFLFNVEDLQVQKLTIKLMNVDEADVGIFVGFAELAIEQLEANVGEEFWVDLAGDPEKLRGRSAGKVHLLVEFKPDGQTNDINGTANWTAGAIDPSALLVSEPDGSLMTHGDRNHVAMENARDGFNAEIQGLPRLVADMKVDPKEPAETARKLSCPEEPIKNCKDKNGVAVAQHLAPCELESSPKVPSIGEELGCELAIPEKPEGTDCVLPEEKDSQASIEKGRETCIVENKYHNHDDIHIGTVNQGSLGKRMEIEHKPDLIVVGDPAWGLNGLSLEHCGTSELHEDIFASEIFEVD